MRKSVSRVVAIVTFLAPLAAMAQAPVYVYGGFNNYNQNQGVYGGAGYYNSYNQGFYNTQTYSLRENWHGDQGRYGYTAPIYQGFTPIGSRQITGGWNNFDHNRFETGNRSGASWGSQGGIQYNYGGGWNNFNGAMGNYGGYRPYGW